MCQHQPPCPQRWQRDRLAARIAVDRPEQGWALLCNGVILFEDDTELWTEAAIARASRENQEYVRTLLSRKQPDFARALARAEQELAAQFCCTRSGPGCRKSGRADEATTRPSVVRAA